MEWYWVVLIVLGALAVLVLLCTSTFMFIYAFCANRRAVRRMFQKRELDPSPLVRMRFDTKAYMDALPSEPMTLISHDGLKLAARFFPNGGTKKIAVIMHGWHSLPWWDFGKAFDVVYDAGYAVLAVQERAQGESEGSYMTYGEKESKDLLGWLDALIGRCGTDARIAVMGVSMGAATVLAATGKPLPEQVKCAVADCSYTSAKEQFKAAAKGAFPISRALIAVYARVLAKTRCRDASPIDAVKRSKTPTLFVHGESDDFVPFSMMQTLFDACAAPEKETWSSPNALHAEAALTNPEEYAAHVLPFLATYL